MILEGQAGSQYILFKANVSFSRGLAESCRSSSR